MRETRRAKIKTTWTGHDATVAVACTTQGDKGHLAECEWCRCCDVVIQIGRWRFTAPVDRIIEAVGVAPTGQGPTEKRVQQRLACQTVVSLVQFRGSLKGDDFVACRFSAGSIRKVQSDATTSCNAEEVGDGVGLGFNWFV